MQQGVYNSTKFWERSYKWAMYGRNKCGCVTETGMVDIQ